MKTLPALISGLLVATLLLTTPLLCAANSLAALRDSLAKAAPGTVVELQDGTHALGGALTIKAVRGTLEKPVVIRAAHRGKAVIAGVAGFVLKECEHVILEGFVFHNDADQQCVRLENCRHVRVTRNVFEPAERDKPDHWEHWLTVEGADSGRNRIDHNLFGKKVNRGSPLFVRGDDVALVCSQNDRIDHNHFRDVIYADDENGHETIRTGGNDLGASGRASFTIIEDNLLERCGGEQEIISLKSSENIVRRNTFIDCRGCICLRLGHRSEVHDNLMLNPGGVPGAGGVKVYGAGHRITRNWFQDLTGAGHESPLVLVPGTMETETTDQIGKAYKDFTTTAPVGVIISQNTWIDCVTLLFGDTKPNKDHPFTPRACVFTDNMLIRTRPMKQPLIRLGLVRELKAENNIAHTDKPDEGQMWSSWFKWEEDRTDVKAPKPLTAAKVGPDAP